MTEKEYKKFAKKKGLSEEQSEEFRAGVESLFTYKLYRFGLWVKRTFTNQN